MNDSSGAALSCSLMLPACLHQASKLPALPATASGKAYQDTFATFVQDWQAGKVPDLKAGLATVAQQINDQLSLGQAP